MHCQAFKPLREMPKASSIQDPYFLCQLLQRLDEKVLKGGHGQITNYRSARANNKRNTKKSFKSFTAMPLFDLCLLHTLV